MSKVKFIEGVKYEAQPAKSTVPKGYIWSYLDHNTWYPARDYKGFGDCFEYYRAGRWHCAGQTNCCHLEGGNWKIRKVKDVS